MKLFRLAQIMLVALAVSSCDNSHKYCDFPLVSSHDYIGLNLHGDVILVDCYKTDLFDFVEGDKIGSQIRTGQKCDWIPWNSCVSISSNETAKWLLDVIVDDCDVVEHSGIAAAIREPNSLYSYCLCSGTNYTLIVWSKERALLYYLRVRV